MRPLLDQRVQPVEQALHFLQRSCLRMVMWGDSLHSRLGVQLYAVLCNTHRMSGLRRVVHDELSSGGKKIMLDCVAFCGSI